MNALINQHQQLLQELVKNNDVAYLGLFGSTARNEQTENSDIDLLIRFKTPGGLLRRARVQRKLEAIFHKKVDLVSQKALSPMLKPYIDKELITIYPENL